MLAVLSLAALALIGRPLVFASLQAELAEARGVPLRFVSAAFLAIVAVAVAECAQIVGVLLVFTLMVGPAAAAMNLTRRLPLAVALSAGLALAEAWGGLTLAYYTDWPTSFWITALSGMVFFGGAASEAIRGVGSGAQRFAPCGEGCRRAGVAAIVRLFPRCRALGARAAVAAAARRGGRDARARHRPGRRA